MGSNKFLAADNKIEVIKYNSGSLSLFSRMKPRFHTQTSFLPETFKSAIIIDFKLLISRIDDIKLLQH